MGKNGSGVWGLGSGKNEIPYRTITGKKRDRLLFWLEVHPAASEGFAFASLLTQASIASRCQFRFAMPVPLRDASSAPRAVRSVAGD